MDFDVMKIPGGYLHMHMRKNSVYFLENFQRDHTLSIQIPNMTTLDSESFLIFLQSIQTVWKKLGQIPSLVSNIA